LSPKLPVIKARQLIKVVKKLGFELDRQSGSHAIYYRKSDKRRIVIPTHAGKDIKPKTLFSIIKDINLDVDEFKKLL
jgi:predicted RNA binding protein YcfA (HicA-like mRNA interferase family)